MARAFDEAGAAQLLAADVVTLEYQLAHLTQELRIAREMVAEALALAHQAIAHIATLQAR